MTVLGKCFSNLGIFISESTIHYIQTTWIAFVVAVARPHIMVPIFTSAVFGHMLFNST